MIVHIQVQFQSDNLLRFIKCNILNDVNMISVSKRTEMHGTHTSQMQQIAFESHYIAKRDIIHQCHTFRCFIK